MLLRRRWRTVPGVYEEHELLFQVCRRAVRNSPTYHQQAGVVGDQKTTGSAAKDDPPPTADRTRSRISKAVFQDRNMMGERS